MEETMNLMRRKIMERTKYMSSSNWWACARKTWWIWQGVKTILITQILKYPDEHLREGNFIVDWILEQNYGGHLSRIFEFSFLCITKNKFDLNPSNAYFFLQIVCWTKAGYLPANPQPQQMGNISIHLHST